MPNNKLKILEAELKKPKNKQEIQLKVKWKRPQVFSNNGIKEQTQSIGYSCKQWNCPRVDLGQFTLGEASDKKNFYTTKEGQQSHALLALAGLKDLAFCSRCFVHPHKRGHFTHPSLLFFSK